MKIQKKMDKQKQAWSLLSPVIILIFVVLAGALIVVSCAGGGNQAGQAAASPSPVPSTNPTMPLPQPTLPLADMTIGSADLTVELAKSQDEQTLGLSWRPSMEENHGMLFIFSQEKIPSFWMHGMQFPLDFLWIRDGKVTQIHANIPTPSSASDPPATVRPDDPVDMVLEVNAGYAQRRGVNVGDPVQVSERKK
jgi:uncharacterized protein